MRVLPLCPGRFSQVSLKPRPDCVFCSRRWPLAKGDTMLPQAPYLSTPAGGWCPMRVHLGTDFELLPDALSNKASVSPALGPVPGAGGTSLITFSI